MRGLTGKNIISLGIIIILVSLGFWGNSYGWVTEDNVTLILSQYQSWAPILFILIYVLATLVFIPAIPLSLLGGGIFGPVYGSIYILIGATIGAISAFLAARFMLRDWVSQMIKRRMPSLERYDQYLANNGFNTVIFLRLVPIFPFNGLNFALGFTRVSLISYSLGTLIGIIPGVLVLSFFGSSLANRDPQAILIAGALYGGLALFGVGYAKYRKS